jgi:hypothetical protein
VRRYPFLLLLLFISTIVWATEIPKDPTNLTFEDLMNPDIPLVSKAEAEASREYLIKAAFIFNFVKFVDWPSELFKDKAAPIKLYILGNDPFGEALATIRDKKVKGRRLTITRVQRVEEIKGAHLLFISPSEKGRVRQILQSLRNTPVLTISEIEGFGQMGGIINFITVEDKVQFEINSEQAQQHQLKISSQLLKLARIVRSEP